MSNETATVKSEDDIVRRLKRRLASARASVMFEFAVVAPLIVAITAVGSAFVDNVVFVSTFIPIVKKIVAGAPEMSPLWWALLFGACFGGNITAIGSTANLVAISMLGKRYSIKVAFLEWLKVGLVVGIVSCAVATGVILCYYKV